MADFTFVLENMTNSCSAHISGAVFMKKYCCLMLFLFGQLISANTHAEWKTSAASELATACKSNRRGNEQEVRVHFSLCSMPIKGFLDGYKRGAAKGLLTAFIDDRKNLATTEGINDLQNRIGILRRRSECFPPSATTEQVEEVFLNFLRKHSNRAADPYPDVLSDSIEEYFCPTN